VQDAATLFSVIRWLRALTRELRLTTVASLLQPPPETFQLFDDVMVMNEGTIVYHGPVPGAVPFMASLGFDIPPRKVR
jgi:ABC-type multidrug transport system ATPase subunit